MSLGEGKKLMSIQLQMCKIRFQIRLQTAHILYVESAILTLLYVLLLQLQLIFRLCPAHRNFQNQKFI